MKLTNKIQIGERKVGVGEPTYIIAEIGANHNQDLNLALEMISMAAEAGADAVKFQSIRFDQLYNPQNESKEFAQWFKQIELDESWYPDLTQRALKEGVDFLSSPTYLSAIDLLEGFKVPAYKIASPQVQGNLELLRKAAGTGKPLIMSMGYSEYGDIARAVGVCNEAGNQSLLLLHCVSKYPVAPGEANLRFISTLAEMTGLPTGYSDHTLGTHMAVAAVSLGACVIEKHVTTDRTLEGPDHRFALTFPEFKSMVEQIREVESGLGSGARLTLLPEEMALREKVKLKAVALRDISSGEKLSEENIRFMRASGEALGVEERYLFSRLKSNQRIPKGSLVAWQMVSLA